MRRLAVAICSGVVLTLVLLGYLVGKLLFGQEWPPGFATLVVLLLMSMTLNAMFLGILGEYIGRIFLQTKNINAPIVEAALNAAGIPAVAYHGGMEAEARRAEQAREAQEEQRSEEAAASRSQERQAPATTPAPASTPEPTQDGFPVVTVPAREGQLHVDERLVAPAAEAPSFA